MRKLVTVLLLIAMVPWFASAQQPGRTYRIGELRPGPPGCIYPDPVAAQGAPWEGQPLDGLDIGLRLGLREAGLGDPSQLVFERRCYQALHQIESLAADLKARDIDAAAVWSLSAILAAKRTLSVPVVFIGSDPVHSSLVESMARPGGNVTGVSSQSDELVAKRVQYARELVPHAKALGYMYVPEDAATQYSLPEIRAAATQLDFDLRQIPVENWNEIDGALVAMRRQRPDVLLITAAGSMSLQSERLLQLATADGLPTICSSVLFVERGCLLGYSADPTAMATLAGRMLGKILLGAKPAEMPVEQSTKHQLWLNARTAAALGITIPPTILARADRVIE